MSAAVPLGVLYRIDQAGRVNYVDPPPGPLSLQQLAKMSATAPDFTKVKDEIRVTPERKP